MSRATHDIECTECGYKGKVVDDSIICPKCGISVEGQPLTGAALVALIAQIKSKKLSPEAIPAPASKEIKG